MKNEENNIEQTEQSLMVEPKTCDQATKPPSSPRPAGYSDRAFIDCNTATGEWFWNDPQVAPE